MSDKGADGVSELFLEFREGKLPAGTPSALEAFAAEPAKHGHKD